MMTLSVQVSPELASVLDDEARRRGVTVAQYAESLLRQSLGNNCVDNGLRRRPIEDLLRLGQEQGVSPVARFEDLLGNSWPEEEDVDEFIASTRTHNPSDYAGVDGLVLLTGEE